MKFVLAASLIAGIASTQDIKNIEEHQYIIAPFQQIQSEENNVQRNSQKLEFQEQIKQPVELKEIQIQENDSQTISPNNEDHVQETTQNNFNNPNQKKCHKRTDIQQSLDKDPLAVPRPPHDRHRHRPRQQGRSVSNGKPKHDGKLKHDGNLRHDQSKDEMWMNHKQKKDHKDKGHRGKGCLLFAITALIFTIFGLLLGKCIRKCKKGDKKYRKCENRSTSQIKDKIQKTQKKLKQLKDQLSKKTAQQQRRTSEQRRMLEMRNQYMQRVQPPHVQPASVQPRMVERYNQPVNYSQQGYYQNYYSPNVPVGRPINSSSNSSFAEEHPYPQL